MRIIACNSPYGQGGVGQHFAQLIEASRTKGLLDRYYAPSPKSGDEKGRRLDHKRWQDWVVQYTPVRFSPGWKSHLYNEFFDRRVARRLRHVPERFMGFVGKSLRSFRRAATLGTERLELIAANSHVHNLKRKHDWAQKQHGIGDSWLNMAQLRKTLQEYEAADRIFVHSDYTRKSFLDANFSPDTLERTYLSIHPRFCPPNQRSDDGFFHVVYVGRVEATKGIPLLLEAFSNLPLSDKRLTIVGGWSTRRMRKYMEPWLNDDRIRMAPGDPLPVLHEADVFVNPTYEDGFGYAPMEALASGVPAIVTTDTGMKEYIREAENGYVVPTGRVSPIVERLMQLYHHPKAGTRSLLPPQYDDERSHTDQLLSSMHEAND